MQIAEGAQGWMNTRRFRLAAVAVAALALTSCSGGSAGTGGVAASVGEDEVTIHQVDDVAALLCTLSAANAPAEGTPTKGARATALTLLIGNELAFDLIDEDAVPQQAISAGLGQAAQIRAGVPEDQLDLFDDLVRDSIVADTGIRELGRASLAASGAATDQQTDEAAAQEGERLRSEYAAEAGIEVDPRFGTVEDGVLKPGSGSLSVPVTDLAVQGEDAESTSLAGMLPDTQKCG